MTRPNKRQQSCKYAYPFTGINHDETHCSKHPVKDKSDKYDFEMVSNETCEQCDLYKSKYIQYPLTISSLDLRPIETDTSDNIGKPVRIQPCADEYNNKTFLGIYLGRLPKYLTANFSEPTETLTCMTVSNPAIYVPELHKIIYGIESFWQIIKSPEDLKDITSAEIENQWYIAMLKDMIPKEENDD